MSSTTEHAEQRPADDFVPTFNFSDNADFAEYESRQPVDRGQSGLTAAPDRAAAASPFARPGVG